LRHAPHPFGSDGARDVGFHLDHDETTIPAILFVETKRLSVN
jgi:hypothetical protein